MSAVLPHRHQWRDALVFSTDERVDVYTLAVATALHVHMDHTGRCTVGLRRLAGLARCSVPTVRARVGVLVDAGWLTVEGGTRERATYRATIPPQESPDGPVDDATGSRASVQPQGATRPESVQPDCTRTPEPMNPWRGRARGAPARRYDPSVGRPSVDRPPPDVGGLVEADDGTLWVTA